VHKLYFKKNNIETIAAQIKRIFLVQQTGSS